MTVNNEIGEPLREIRDLQRAHFERYQQITPRVLGNNQAAGLKAEH